MAAHVTIDIRSGSDEPTSARRSSALLSVLPTKLQPPFRRPGIIDRPRLIARLRSTETPFVALIAPAGYGKSTSLAQFVEADARTTAWFSCDTRDDDPVSLVRGLVASIDAAVGLPDDVIDAAAAPGPSVWTVVIPRLAAWLRAAPPTLTIVIDDVDRIGDTEAIAVVLAIADQLAGATRVLLGGRSSGSVPLARLTAEGRATTLGRDDLALDAEEAEGLLAAVGVALPEADVARLTTRTEGWATGLYLSSLAEDPLGHPGHGTSPTAPERLIEEYLRTEVLAPMAPADADLILRSSILDELSGPLCDAVLERTGSAADLDRLERTNLLLIAVDAERRWFRFHHLLGDLLRRELERRDPGAIAGLRARAAVWHESHDQPEVALEYHMAAGDADDVARLASMAAQGALNAGRVDTARRWFAWLDGRTYRFPRLAAIATLLFAVQGDRASADHWAAVAELDAVGGDGSGAGERALARIMLARTGVADMARDAEAALDLTGPDDPWRVAALASVGLVRHLAGDPDEGDRYLLEAIETWGRGSTANTAACLACIQLAAAALDRADRAAAEQHIRRARGILSAHGLTEHPIAAGIDALNARTAMSRGNAAQARADLAHAQRLRPHLTLSFPWLAIRVRLDLIRAHLALSDSGGARTLMQEVRDALEQRPDMGTLVAEAAELDARLAAIRGGVAGASSLTVAELRLLPLLTTHLSFREIGERLFVSQNTVKTQAISIYRKLDATSRGEAIQRAVGLGLLESAAPSERFIPAG
jgi:LuxR family maltose regulon positive regulatory protein